MSCFGNRISPDLYHNCCNGNTLCEFSGCLDDLVTEPIYVQKVYDAVLFNLQGMKTVQNQCFSPRIPRGHRVRRVVDIRCKRFFNPANIDDKRNLNLEVETSVSGASFLQRENGDYVEVIGPDGTFSQKVLYADTQDCDDKCMGTPVFGTQSIAITGNVLVYMDLLLLDSCNNESIFTVWTEVNIADCAHPLMLTNFFELCMPSVFDGAFLPRFTEFCNTACETRLATNNFGRDLNISPDGLVCGNLIIALCISCEKKITVPVQLCVLSTGFALSPTQVGAVCTTFPTLFPNQIKESDTIENCGEIAGEDTDDCGCRDRGCNSGCNSGCDCCDDCCDTCNDCGCDTRGSSGYPGFDSNRSSRCR